MSNCYLIFEDGYLVCTVNHIDYSNCDLTVKEPSNVEQQ